MTSSQRISAVALLSGLLLLSACQRSPADADHADADHADADHGHAHGSAEANAEAREPLAITVFTDKTELFVEFPPLVVGQPSKFAAHITRLSDYAPNRQGRLVVRIEGPTRQEVSAEAPKRPGIYGPELIPTQPGQYRMTIEVSGPELTDTLEVGAVTVYASAKEVPVPTEAGGPEPVTFLKEQAWRIPFHTEVVKTEPLPSFLQGFGRLEAVPGKSARVSAPVSGVVVPSAAGFPVVGQTVQRGQTLALLLPGPADGQELSSLERERAQAQARLTLARSDLQRLKTLAGEAAATVREVEEAEAQVTVFDAELKAATQRLATLSPSSLSATPSSPAGNSGTTGNVLPLQAPLTGRISAVKLGGQQATRAGETLFELVEASALRLRVEVAEADLPQLKGITDAWIFMPGEPAPQLISALGGRLLSVSHVLDEQTRSVPVWFELPNPEGRYFAGTSVRAQLVTSAPPTPLRDREAQRPADGGNAQPDQASPSEPLSVGLPGSAVVDDNGKSIVYIQLEGEAFERREVTVRSRVGPRAFVQGVKSGERVVTQGAYEIRLASLSGSGFGEGHSH